jgi:antitoxin YefM
MLPVVKSYTSYTQARDNFVKVLEQVEQGDSIVVVQRRGHADVAMIAADELSALLEQLHLLRSPANAKRLFAALEWSQQRLDESPTRTTVEQLRFEMEAELDQEETSKT